jgi:osmotically-inducible protein OsmY
MSVLTDAGLTLKIKTALIADERVVAGDINVDTVEGTVILRGTVPSSVERELAEAIAVANGAHEVQNELGVTELDTPPRTIIPDAFPGVSASAGAPRVEPAIPRLEEAVRAALAADRRVNEHLIIVAVDPNHTAILTGRQDTVDARDAATEAATHVPGIAAVVNDLEVLPSV